MKKQKDIQSIHDLNEENEKEEIRKYFNNNKNGVCVEFGSNEPTSVCSQSLHFEERLNWKCILIEPNPDLVIKTKNIRPKAIIHECACVSNDNVGYMELQIPLLSNGVELTGHASLEKNSDEHNYKSHKSVKVKTETLTSILESDGIDTVDFLSIDVEGTELEVLKGIDFDKFEPKLILLEDKHLYLNKHLYLKKKGYVLVQRLNRNCWYIPSRAHRPDVKLKEKIKLFKRLYFSIWFNKLTYALTHKTLKSFQTL